LQPWICKKQAESTGREQENKKKNYELYDGGDDIEIEKKAT
jgi:hypothetical protein